VKLSLVKPTIETIQGCLEEVSKAEFTHKNVGSTQLWSLDKFGQSPSRKILAGDMHQFRRTSIGTQEHDYAAAVSAVRNGICFDLGWVSCYQNRSFEPGDDFCLMTRAFGVWTSNFCRVVYMREETIGSAKVFSLGLGTLPLHAAAGEERFSIVFDCETQEVDFLLGSYSRPRAWLAKRFVNYLRSQQNRFANESGHRMHHQLVRKDQTSGE
jgi:uncharacterized protein (UPF0548 family)